MECFTLQELFDRATARPVLVTCVYKKDGTYKPWSAGRCFLIESICGNTAYGKTYSKEYDFNPFAFDKDGNPVTKQDGYAADEKRWRLYENTKYIPIILEKETLLQTSNK